MHCVLQHFSMEPQEQSNWCWDAVAVSIDDFRTEGAKLQCTVAKTVLSLAYRGLGDCCVNPTPCNKPWYLREALSALGRLNNAPGSGTGAGPLLFPAIMTEIDAGRPVGIQIEWFGGAYFHFAAIAGYGAHAAVQRVQVYDPNGPAAIISWMNFDEFKTLYNYQSSTGTGGKWIDSFLVT